MSASKIFSVVLLGHHNTQHKLDSVAFYAQIEGLSTPPSQLLHTHCEITPNATLSNSIRNQIWRPQPAQTKLAITFHASHPRTAEFSRLPAAEPWHAVA